MTGYIILFFIGIVLQIGAIGGVLFTARLVETKTHTQTVQRIIDRETGEKVHEDYGHFDSTKWKIIKR